MNSLGSFYWSIGDKSEAIFYFYRPLEEDPLFVYAHYNLSKLKTHTSGDTHLISMIELTENNNKKKMVSHCFALLFQKPCMI